MAVRPANSAIRVGPLICYPTVSARSAVLLVAKGFEYKFIDMNETWNSDEASICLEHMQSHSFTLHPEGRMAKSIGGNPISQPEPSATNSLDQVVSSH